MARTLDKPQEPTFQTVKVAPSHTPPTDLARTKEPFIRPTTPPLLKATDRSSTDTATIKQQAASSSQPNQPERTVFPSSDSGSVSSDQPPVHIFIEEGELSDDQDVTLTDPDQSLSEEQTYRDIEGDSVSYGLDSHSRHGHEH